MKKLGLFVLIYVLAAFGCSSDDTTPQVGDGAMDAPGDATGDGTPTTDGQDIIDGWAGDGQPSYDLSGSDWKSGNTVPADGWNWPTPDGGGNNPLCNGKVYKCSDGTDNDGDGLVDAQDPECTGPCDDDEGSFGTGIPGDNKDPCRQDCFFDGNSGAGDDGCDWNLKCDPANPGQFLKCPYKAGFANCTTTQTTQCMEKCKAIVPNGCDCFGCCQIFTATGTYTVYLGSGPDCSTATPEKCAPCTQSQDCVDPCGECELCLGKTIADLPSSCFPTSGDGGPSPTDGGVANDGAPFLPICPTGTPCLSNSHCQTGYYCVTGCCKRVTID